MRRSCLAAVVACASLALAVAAQEAPAGAEASASAAPSARPEASASPTSSPEPSPAILEGTWHVLAYDAWGEGLAEPRRSSRLTISLLTGGRLEGETGCGRYNGGYSQDGERIGLGIISKGFGACGPRRTEEAVAFSVALEAVARWEPSEDGSGVLLLDDAGTVRVILERDPDGDVTGDWRVTSYTRNSGEPAEPLPGSPMRLTLGPEGRASGSTGCRFFEGEYRLEGERIVIGPLELLGLPCEGPARGPERRLLRLFGETVFWRRDGQALRLTDTFGGSLVELVAVPGTEPGASPEPDDTDPPAPSLGEGA